MTNLDNRRLTPPTEHDYEDELPDCPRCKGIGYQIMLGVGKTECLLCHGSGHLSEVQVEDEKRLKEIERDL